MSDFSRARGLLLACAVWDADAGVLERVRARAAEVLDWSEAIARLRMHRLVPHAHRALVASAAPVPGAPARALAGEAMAIGARALGRTRQLSDLARCMEEAGVRALAFKGPALSLAAYGDAGVRDSIDLDFVVSPRDVGRARAALLDAGYRSRTEMSAAQERMLQRSFGHFSYAREGAPAGVELHWRFGGPRYPWSMPVDDVIARSRTVEIAGASVVVAEPTDELLLQAMHGARHQWEYLEWLVTFAKLLRGPRVDRAALVERARASGSLGALAVAMQLARDLLGTPPTVAPPVRAPGGKTDEIAGEIVRRIDRGIETGESLLEQPHALNMRMMDRSADRVRYVALGIFAPTPREWELVRLPDPLLVLYYPIRVLRVLARRLRSLVARR